MSATVRLTMPAKAEYLVLTRLVLAGIAMEVTMSEPVLADLKLATTEVCGNAIRHAYGTEPGAVRVVFEIEPDAIEVRVEDDGGGTAQPDLHEDAPLDDLHESGMGLAIVKAVMDEVEIENQDSSPGTFVRMRKRLD